MKLFKGKKFLLFGLLFLHLSFTGCVYVVVGSIAALGGYVVSPDTVEGIAKVDEQTLWDTSMDIVSIMGTIQEQYQAGADNLYSGKDAPKPGQSIILAVINGAKVTITITPIGVESAKLSVKARKAFIPKMTIAQDVFVKIMTHVEEH